MNANADVTLTLAADRLRMRQQARRRTVDVFRAAAGEADRRESGGDEERLLSLQPLPRRRRAAHQGRNHVYRCVI